VAVSNFNLFFPFFIFHLVNKRKNLQTFVEVLTDLINKLFVIRKDILGVRFLIIGPFRTKRRSIFSFSRGSIAYNSYDSKLIYDMIHCPTTYGMSNLKIWIYYPRTILPLYTTMALKKLQLDER
jgi:hypothetical protein